MPGEACVKKLAIRGYWSGASGMNSALRLIEPQRKSVYLNTLEGAQWILVEVIASVDSFISSNMRTIFLAPA